MSREAWSAPSTRDQEVPVPPDRSPRPRSVRRAVTPVLEFLGTEAGGAVVLLVATAIALVWANSPWSGSYETFWQREIALGPGPDALDHDLRHWVNEGLMTLFFLVVGLEIKRELVAGELDSARKALLPAIAAGGGMLMPALVYLAFNAGTAEAAGWGIPIATDIAFAAGALSFFGRGLSPSARVFLLSLAIVDDIGAIVLIAVVYSSGIQGPALLVAAGILAAVVTLRGMRVAWMPLHVLLGIGLWIALAESGVHATLAGVAIAFTVPAQPTDESPARKVMHALHPCSSYVVVPLFALANAGVEISGDAVTGTFTSRLGLGIVAGLVIGKLIGVFGATRASVALGLQAPPEDGWRTTAGVAALAGIGFTVSLFIAELAFGGGPALVDAKIAILGASILATALGGLMLRRVRAAPLPG
ncbi:MAG TPA: Na+/H+ antiporter NhaA [Actinomycetota bacterium]